MRSDGLWRAILVVFLLALSRSARGEPTFEGFVDQPPADLRSELIQATDGSFYGTTSHGGACDLGTVFRIDASRELTTLYSFGTGASDGAYPSAALVEAVDGNLYGTTSGGGAFGRGTVFRIGASGALTTLHSFSGADGESPCASLVQASDGRLYGTARLGGASGRGVVFRLGPIESSPPFRRGDSAKWPNSAKLHTPSTRAPEVRGPVGSRARNQRSAAPTTSKVT